jgi:hypothetical protein
MRHHYVHKILCVILILLVCLIILNNRSYAASSTIYNTISQSKLKDLLGTIGGSVSIKDNNSLEWMIPGVNKIAIIKINDNNNEIILLFNSKDIQLSSRKVNEWNMEQYISKVFFDNDHSPFLEFDYDLTGGVSEANILSFFNICAKDIDLFVIFAKNSE